MSLKVLLLLVPIALTACTDDKGARRVLTEQGFTDIVMTGYDAWACGRGDDFATGFIATNANKRRVAGVVCSGLMKGYTVRFK